MNHCYRIATAAIFVAILASPHVEAKNDKKLRRGGARDIAGEYIVTLAIADTASYEDVHLLAGDVAVTYELTIDEVWAYAGAAFFTRMTDERAAVVSNDPRVSFVEANAEWDLSAEIPTNVDPITCDPTSTTCGPVMDNRLWHLDRIDNNTPTPSLSQSYCTTGTGVTVYVVDTGVNKNHQEFGPGGARVLKGFNASQDGMDADDPCVGFASPPGLNAEAWGNYLLELGRGGHGTAVASLVGGRRIGVAKNVTIVPVKVSRCDRYSARMRLNSRAYVQNETMFIVNTMNGNRQYYRALDGGISAPSEAATWPTTTTSVMDGTVRWQYLPPGAATFSTDNLKRGLNWILSAQNTIGPKHHAVVTLSTYFVATVAGVAGTTDSVEASIRSLLAANMTVIASANNQNGNACDTSPGRMSINNPTGEPNIANNVITVGGTMLVNRPWSVAVVTNEAAQIYEADGIRAKATLGPYGPEPAYLFHEPVREARWICGAGDSAVCSNDTATQTIASTSSSYTSWNGGSNGGPCVTLFAPAKNVVVAGLLAFDDYRDPRVRGIANTGSGMPTYRGNASGTSWSAPIVAGVAARILEANPTFTPLQVRAKLLENSVPTLDEETLNPYTSTGAQLTGTPNKSLRDGDINITAQPQSTPAAASGATTLSVAAASLTSAAFTYQWFEVNAGFDYAAYTSGAFSSLKLAGATGSTYQAPAAVSTRAYWVRISNGCSTADSGIAVVVPRPQSPTNAVATAAATATGAEVTVTWSIGTGAEKYEVQRKVAGQPWTRAGLVPSGTFTFTDAPVVPGGMVVYRVLAVAGAAYLPTTNLAGSPPSNSDIANLNDPTYEAIAAPPASITSVKAQHVLELRQAVNGLCDAIGVAQQFAAGDLALSSLLGTSIKAADFTGLMTKVNLVRTNALLAVGSAAFANTPAVNGVIQREHLESLRAALR